MIKYLKISSTFAGVIFGEFKFILIVVRFGCCFVKVIMVDFVNDLLLKIMFFSDL